MQQGLLVASHNELQRANHIPDFPDQAAITTFLRGLLTEGRTQVTWARDSGVPYNTLTNYFTAAAPKMSAENLLRLVISASAGESFAVWLAKYGGTIHNATQEPARGRLDTIPDPFVMPKVEVRKSATGRKGKGRRHSA
jgi:hypothetical protein